MRDLRWRWPSNSFPTPSCQIPDYSFQSQSSRFFRLLNLRCQTRPPIPVYSSDHKQAPRTSWMMQTEVNSNVSYAFKFLKLLKKSDCCRKIKQKIHPFFGIKWKSGTTEGDVTKKIVFSGDIGNVDQPIIKDPSYTDLADYIVVESTYGNRIHTAEKPDYLGEFTRIIKETFDRGGNVVIPSFAVGRTQEMLYFIREIKEKHLLPEYEDFDVYLDSPLAIEATKVFTMNMRDCFDKEAMELVNAGINPLVFPGLHISTTSDDSKMINFIEKPKVIISASGMCDAGRIRHHLKHNLWRPECTILFVGYQANGTLGRSLIEGEKNVKLFGEPIEVHAHIESLHGVSGHADMNGLLSWIGAFVSPIERVFVVHGEDTVTEEFAHTVEEKFGYSAWAPYPCCEADLLKNEIVNEGVRVPVKAKKAARRKSDSAFERLVAAGRRLLDIIYKNEGLSNKDKAKFETQINNLSDKWED